MGKSKVGRGIQTGMFELLKGGNGARNSLREFVVLVGIWLAMIALALLMYISEAKAASTFKQWWKADSESTGEVQLLKVSQAWDALGGDSATGSWDSDLEAYYFILDPDNFKQTDFASLYNIMEDGSVVSDSFSLGAWITADSLRDHYEAESGVHGATGDVVGTSDSQTLTNKTIDGDDNTVQDLPGSVMAEGAEFPQVSFQPSASDDVSLIVDGGADYISLQASDSAASSDMELQVIAANVVFSSDALADIVVTGVKLSTTASSVVPREHIDSLATRIDELERDDEFNGSPEVNLDLQAREGGVMASFWMGAVADEDSLKRYEIYWFPGDISIPAGTDAAKRTYLMNRCMRQLVRYGEGNNLWIRTEYEVDVAVIAFDWVGTMVFSDVKSATPRAAGRPGRDQEGEVIEVTRMIGGSMHMAANATGNTAAEFTEYVQSDTNEKIKYRCTYRYDALDQRIRMWFYSWSGTGAGEYGYVKLAIMAGTSEVKSGLYKVSYATGDYPSTAQSMEIDVGSGLTNNALYELEVSIWSGGSYDTELKQLTIECDASIPVY